MGVGSSTGTAAGTGTGVGIGLTGATTGGSGFGTTVGAAIAGGLIAGGRTAGGLTAGFTTGARVAVGNNNWTGVGIGAGVESGSTTVSAKPKFGDYEGAIYVRNYDGDTITFNLPNLHPIIGNKIRVRLNGLDTPEIRGKCDKEKYNAEQAKDMVTDILKDAERIDLKNMGRGKYFRIVADE